MTLEGTMTEEEKVVMDKAYRNLVVCDVCGEQIFNDGHSVEGLHGSYVLCDDCYDSYVKGCDL
jgi:formylmethanofuran dehydrogenase subunit E